MSEVNVKARPPARTVRRARLSALFDSPAPVVSRQGFKSNLHDVIRSGTVTVLFFGSPCYHESRALTDRLKKLQQSGRLMGRQLTVVYVPVATFQETRPQVEDDFHENHGDTNWWMVEFQSWEAVEAVYMHGVSVMPALVVVDRGGAVVTESGQVDLEELGNDVLTTWF